MNEIHKKRTKHDDSTCVTLDLSSGEPTPVIIYGGERYQLGQHIGKGGFSHCYCYKGKSGNVLLAKVTCHFEAAKRFENDVQLRKKSWLNEVKILSMLSHSNIVRYFTSVEDTTLRYILMELCAMDLQKAHKAEPFMSTSKVRRLMIDILNGLDFIHQKNIVHRDIKLSNLLLTADNRVKICDFGVAMILQNNLNMISKRDICGTVNYLAPEMIGSESKFELTTAVDVWSAGCVMFILLNGEGPFRASKKSYVFVRIRHRIFSVSDAVKRQPAGLAAMSICNEIFNTSYSKRPTAAELLEKEFFRDEIALNEIDWIDNPPIFKSLHRKIFLARKLDRVCAAQDGSSSGVSIPLREVEPCWLISYINYSAHIGLPYILSNGRTGVFFEDKTTLLFEPTGKVENGFEYLVGSKQCEMDEASAECKRKKNFLIIFYTELKEMSLKTGHKQAEGTMNRNVSVTGYYLKQKLLIVQFSNGAIQINTVYGNRCRPIEILIGYDYVQLFNGIEYLSFAYDKLPAEIVDLIKEAKENFENDINEAE